MSFFNMSQDLEKKKILVEEWFSFLRDRICSTLEQLERDLEGNFSDYQPGRFSRKTWNNNEKDNRTVSILRGRVFEKATIVTSTISRKKQDLESSQKNSNLDVDSDFWISKISLNIHPQNPHVPSIQMNNRMVIKMQEWFDGEIDLTPMLTIRKNIEDPDTITFNKALEFLCNQHQYIANYEHFRKWCDTYFFIPYRNESRGIGGIFYEKMHSPEEYGGWQEDFSFIRDLGRTFTVIYPYIVRNNFNKSWNEQERNEQLIERGKYLEFNLLCDQGSVFSDKIGENIEEIISSLPPIARWP